MNPPPPIPLEEAIALVLASARPLADINPRLDQANGRFLATPLVAPDDLPRETSSLMDGYALRAAEADQELTVAYELPAGRAAPRPLNGGECARIFTGAPLPPGADTVIMQEKARRNGDKVRFDHTPAPGEHIRAAGSEARAGDMLLPAGTRLDGGTLALCASVGLAHVTVKAQPRLALMVTGNELRAPGSPLAPGEVYESNSVALAWAAREAGAQVDMIPPCPDDPDQLEQALRGVTADVIVTSGGASVGAYDFAGELLQRLGGRRLFWQVAIRPGRPVLCGLLDRPDGRTLFFALPGNPAASALTFDLLVRPSLRALAGATQPRRPRLMARLTAPLKKPAGLTFLARGRLAVDAAGQLHFAPVAQQGSMSIATYNAVAPVPPEMDRLPEGALIPTELHGSLDSI